MFINRKKLIFIFSILVLIFILIFPDVARDGIVRGLLICTNIIIPSLFPFMVCISVISKCNLSLKFKLLDNIVNFLFGQNCVIFLTFVLSLIGGYPIGAKLINELITEKSIDQKSANIMLSYCVNAGPAFIISAIGCGVFNSQKTGIILYVAHVISSLFIAIISRFSLKKSCLYNNNIIKISNKNIFVSSIYDATKNIINICSFVIFFSCINSCVEYVLNIVPIINYVSPLLEITSSISKHKNVYLTSFLLGFSGISVWFQIFAISSNIKIKYFRFILCRILHGTFSLLLTKIFLFVFKIKISVFNNTYFTNGFMYTNASLFVSMFIMLIVLITFVYTKNNSGKLLKDVI